MVAQPLNPKQPKLTLIKETQRDGSILTAPFTKEWLFNEEVTDLSVNIVDNSYQNSVTEADFVKDGKNTKGQSHSK